MTPATLAIIRRPKYGVGDRGTVVLRLETYVTESSVALQIFNPEQAAEIIAAYGVSDVAALEGKPCWVDTSKPGLITWDRPWKG